jgi:predicted glycosyltransferase
MRQVNYIHLKSAWATEKAEAQPELHGKSVSKRKNKREDWVRITFRTCFPDSLLLTRSHCSICFSVLFSFAHLRPEKLSKENCYDKR